jgi:hypothetical protein
LYEKNDHVLVLECDENLPVRTLVPGTRVPPVVLVQEQYTVLAACRSTWYSRLELLGDAYSPKQWKVLVGPLAASSGRPPTVTDHFRQVDNGN